MLRIIDLFIKVFSFRFWIKLSVGICDSGLVSRAGVYLGKF